MLRGLKDHRVAKILMKNHLPQFVDHETITLSKEGKWLSDGEEITHQATVEAFFRNLARDDRGYFIQIGTNSKRVEIEDTAYFVVGIEGTPHEGCELRLSDGTKVGLDPATLRYAPGRLTCRVMTRIGEEEAKFLRASYFELLSYLQEDDQGYFLEFGGSRVDLMKKERA